MFRKNWRKIFFFVLEFKSKLTPPEKYIENIAVIRIIHCCNWSKKMGLTSRCSVFSWISFGFFSMQSVQNYNFFTMCFPFEYHDEDPKDLFSLRLTAARTTVTSSTLPPATLPNPLARAFFANGDKKFSSCDNLRAINAMEFAQAYKLEKNR